MAGKCTIRRLQQNVYAKFNRTDILLHEELATAILYLLSDEAGTVNGAKIPLYGSY